MFGLLLVEVGDSGVGAFCLFFQQRDQVQGVGSGFKLRRFEDFSCGLSLQTSITKPGQLR